MQKAKSVDRPRDANQEAVDWLAVTMMSACSSILRMVSSSLTGPSLGEGRAFEEVNEFTWTYRRVRFELILDFHRVQCPSIFCLQNPAVSSTRESTIAI